MSYGMQSFGAYRLLRRLGGGMAEVFVAERAGDAMPVVIKRVAERDPRPALLAMLRTEAELLLRCNHPNVVRGIEAGDIDGRPYLTMEYVDGVDLASLMTAGLPPGATVQVMMDVAAALAHVHQASIIHRDVCPSNVIVGRDGVARLTDFGVALDIQTAGAQPQPPRGTYAYMAPEQARGEAIDHRIDIFAMGVIGWELLSGKRLFGDRAAHLTITAVVNEPAPPVAARAFSGVIASALAKQREHRPATAAALSAALSQAAAQLQLPIERDSLIALVHAATAP